MSFRKYSGGKKNKDLYIYSISFRYTRKLWSSTKSERSVSTGDEFGYLLKIISIYTRINRKSYVLVSLFVMIFVIFFYFCISRNILIRLMSQIRLSLLKWWYHYLIFKNITFLKTFSVVFLLSVISSASKWYSVRSFFVLIRICDFCFLSDHWSIIRNLVVQIQKLWINILSIDPHTCNIWSRQWNQRDPWGHTYFITEHYITHIF